MKWLVTILSLISALFSTVPPEDIPEQGISIVIEVSTNEEGEVKTDFEILTPETTDEWTIEEEEVNETTEPTETTETTEEEMVETTEPTRPAEAIEEEEEETTEPTRPAEAIEEEEEETTEPTRPAEAIEEEEVETTELAEPTEAIDEEKEETTEPTGPAEAIEEEKEETTEPTGPAEAIEEEEEATTETTDETEANEWNGEVLKCRKGYTNGPSGKETWYDLKMGGVISIMRNLGYDEEEYPYWVREDGCKMFGPYIMVAGDIRNTRNRGDIVETSLGTAIVCDHCSWAEWHNPTQLDIATDWGLTYSQRD